MRVSVRDSKLIVGSRGPGIQRLAASARVPSRGSTVGRLSFCRASQRNEQTSLVSSKVENSNLDEGDCVPSEEDQEAIAQAARLVLDKAKAVLHEKLDEYDSDLQVLESSASTNFLYGWLNSWTINMLRRKSAFVKDRIQSMTELTAQVESCSLDHRCNFMLRTSADLDEMKRVVSATLHETLYGNDSSSVSTRDASLEQMRRTLKNVDARVEKDIEFMLPAMTWRVDDEARDLEDALWEASLVAARMDGASVKVERKYNCVEQATCRDLRQEAMVNEGISDWLDRSLRTKLDSEMYESLNDVNIAFEVALQAVFKLTALNRDGLVAAMDWVVVLIYFDEQYRPVGLSHVQLVPLWPFFKSLDGTLHWKNLVPVDASQAQTLILWTLPLVAAYGLLGTLRGYHNQHYPYGPFARLAQSASFAADKLQASGRQLQYTSGSTTSDMRILYFLATMESVCVSAPFLWGVLPGVVLKLGAPFGGWLFKGVAVPRIVQIPFISMGVAILCGVGNIIKSAGSDTVNKDANRDETKYVDSLFQVDGMKPVTTTYKDGKLYVRSELGSNPDRVQRSLQTLVPSNSSSGNSSDAVGEAIRRVKNSPPASITMDFLSAGAQRKFNSRQQWIQPTAITISAFYLCLEAQLTGEIAFAAFTQVAAILVLDALSRPWNCVGMSVRVVVTPEGRTGADISKLAQVHQKDQ